VAASSFFSFQPDSSLRNRSHTLAADNEERCEPLGKLRKPGSSEEILKKYCGE